MIYERITPAVFLSRPNRFVAEIELGGRRVLCHVKNTGRCRELLLPGTEVWVQSAQNPERRTGYDLITVRKGERLINIDSSAPNRVFHEWVQNSGYFGKDPDVKPEVTHGDSRFDFFIQSGGRSIFAEIKGVTLENDGVAAFPDAPTERGVKHLRGLMECVRQGYEAYAVFVIQMEGVKYMIPNRATHPEFGLALEEAQAAGVRLLGLGCTVTENSLTAAEFVEVRV